MFRIEKPVKVITPGIPDGAITTNKIANGAVTSQKLGTHIYQHTIYIEDQDTRFYIFSTKSTKYRYVADLPDFELIPATGRLVDNGAAVVITSARKSTNVTLNGIVPTTGMFYAAQAQESKAIADTVTQLI